MMKLDVYLRDSQQWDKKNGYWTKDVKDASDSAWDADKQDIFEGVHKDSWWIKCRMNFVISLMGKYFAVKKSVSSVPPPQTGNISQSHCPIPDIGGSNGIISKMLMDCGYEMLLIEPSAKACSNAARRGVPNIICASIDESFKSNCLGDSLLLDAIEHIEDDLGFLKILNDKMKKGSRLIITTSAFMSLWSSHDEDAQHFRRYLLKDLENKLIKSGFRILNSSYYFSFLFFPILFIRILEKIGIVKKHTHISDKEKAKSLKNRESASKFTLFFINIINRIEVLCVLWGLKIPFGSGMILTAENQK